MLKSFFDRFSSFWILALCLPLLFLPKINLISLSNKESAGIRIDDILLLLFALVFFWAYFTLHQRPSKIERWIWTLVGFSLLSFSLNRLFVHLDILHVPASIFYCLRPLEYFLFFYLGILSSLFFPASSIVIALFIWNLLLMLLQKIELIGQFSVAGYLPTASDRVTGVASFPSEAGLLITMMFCFLIYNNHTDRRSLVSIPPFLKAFINNTGIYWLFLLCITLVTFTGSRIAILSLIIAFIFRIKQTLNKRHSQIIAILFASLTIPFLFSIIEHTHSVSARSIDLLSFRNIELIEKVWDNIDLTHDPLERESVRNDHYDTSWWIRIHKWCYALKIFYMHPETYLQGIGPGFTGAALDGGFIRILTEYGLIGCFIFWQIFTSIYHRSIQLKWMVITLLINMIFFDVYLAYKPMSFLFYLTGYAYSFKFSPASQFYVSPGPSVLNHTPQNQQT